MFLVEDAVPSMWRESFWLSSVKDARTVSSVLLVSCEDESILWQYSE